jgi:hypothetical protein
MNSHGLPWSCLTTLLPLRAVSLVVALCSSTAVAIVLEMPLIWLITSLMVVITLTRSGRAQPA